MSRRPDLTVNMLVDLTQCDREELDAQSLLRITQQLNSTLDTDLLLDSLIVGALQLVGAESGCSGLRTPEGMVCRRYFRSGTVLPLEYCWPTGHGLPGWLIEHKVPYLTNDALSDTQIVHELCEQFGVWSALSTPILGGNEEVLGFFEVHNKKDGTGFTRADRDKLMAVSHSAAIAIQNAIAYRKIKQTEEALRRSEERLETELADTRLLQSVSARLIREENIEALYDHILDAAMAILRSQYGSIQMYYPNRGPGGGLRLLRYRGFSPAAARFWEWVQPDSASTCGMAMSTHERVIVPDVETCGFMSGTDDLAAYLETGIRAVQSTPLFSRNGKLLGMISTHWTMPHDPPERNLRLLDVLARQAADLIERSEAARALRESERELSRANAVLRRANTDLEQFAYSASHDLQEPIRNISIYGEILTRRYAQTLDSKGMEYLSFIAEGARRMEMLVKDLLAYAQSANLEDAPADKVETGAALERALSNLSVAIAESNAEVTHGKLPSVRMPELQLEHLFQNLIGNAIKYRKKEESPRIQISAGLDGEYWLFSVRDNGIGIPPEYKEQVFGMFKRLHGNGKYSGTGIGLAICQKVVERNDGRIWVESDGPGQGSTFHFTLPAGIAE